MFILTEIEMTNKTMFIGRIFCHSVQRATFLHHVVLCENKD